MLQNTARRELARRNPDSLLDWSLAHRFFQGTPMRLIPALRDIYQDRHPFVVIQKAAQVFASEYLVNTALWAADTCQGGRGNVLFVMPTQTQVNDFSQARIDRAIGDSAYLRERLMPLPPGRAGPVRQSLKKVGRGYIYLRGADSRRQLTSVDADVVLLDEYDLMADGVLALAQKRLASSRLGWLRVASTPRLPEAGINGLFLASDQRYYVLRCPACRTEQRLTWDANVDPKRALVVCRLKRCRKPLDLWTPGRWEAAAPGNDRVHGYHLNRLYSPLANLAQVILESEETSPAAQLEFQNSVLGETFVPPGGRLTLDVIDRCRRDYVMPASSFADTYMGVDVGTRMHVVIRERITEEPLRTRAVFIGDVTTLPELLELAARYHVQGAVIDAQPEQRLAIEFAQSSSFDGAVAFYSRYEPGHASGWESGVRVERLNRTQAFEELFLAFEQEAAELPADARRTAGRFRDGVGEYYRQVMALTRVLEQNNAGNWVARYVDNGKPDHFAHAELYCMRAAIRGRRSWYWL
jgi:hypothetical protein